MFVTRLISGMILVAAALGTVAFGGAVLLATTAALSLVGLFELYRVFGIQGNIMGRMGFLFGALYYCLLFLGGVTWVISVFLGFFVTLMAVYVFTFPKFRAEQAAQAFFGFFYVPVMLSCLYQARLLEGGEYVVWLIFLSSWGCDTCAYCVGMLTGKHKMAPVLSPKKSVEGGIGGILGAALLGAAYGVAVQGQMGTGRYVSLEFAAICAVGAVIAQVGDLAASAIKRNYGIKDYGNLIPGHGGVLDRFDSVIFTAPVIYYLAVGMQGLGKI